MSMRNFLENYPIITILIVIWMMVITTGTLLGVFLITPEVGTGLAAVVGTVFALPAAVLTFVKWRFGGKGN